MPTAGVSAQVTAVFDVPATAAVKVCVCEGVSVTLPGVTVTPNGAAVVGAEVANVVLVAEVRPGLVAVNVYLFPGVPTVRLLKVATPFRAVICSVPPSAELPVRLICTKLVAVGSMFPAASSTATVTAGVIGAPVNAFEGCCKNASFAAACGGGRNRQG